MVKSIANLITVVVVSTTPADPMDLVLGAGKIETTPPKKENLQPIKNPWIGTKKCIAVHVCLQKIRGDGYRMKKRINQEKVPIPTAVIGAV
jgi:hypothetical protein